MSRNTAIVLGVVLLHGAVLWAVQSGLMRRVAEVVVPAEILVEIMAPASPSKAPAPTPQPTQQPAPTAPTPVATPQSVPTPLAVAPSPHVPAPSAAAPTAAEGAGNNQGGNSSHAPAAPAAPPAPPAPPKLELPSSDADYLNNARPAYPRLSKQLRETGLVVVRVFIDTDGQASQASVKQSSGFDRLDQTSVETALKWRYLPGKKAGVPQGMWFDLHFNWQLTR